jgi:hypothetical protein
MSEPLTEGALHRSISAISRTGNRLSTAFQRLRVSGPQGVIASAAANFYSRARFVRWELLPSIRATAHQRPEPLLVRRGRTSELMNFRSIWPSRLHEDFYVDELYGVKHFYLAFWDNKLAHISWVFSSRDRTPLISLKPNQVEIRHVRTLEQYRGHRIFTYALSIIVEELRSQGVDEIYSHVLDRNWPSHRAFIDSGFRATGFVDFRLALGSCRARFRRASSEEIEEAMLHSPVRTLGGDL